MRKQAYQELTDEVRHKALQEAFGQDMAISLPSLALPTLLRLAVHTGRWSESQYHDDSADLKQLKAIRHCFTEADRIIIAINAGREALQYLQETGIEVKDMSRLYAPHKDLKERLSAERKEQKQALPPRKRGLRR